MDVFIKLLLIVVGFVLLIKGADFLVKGSSSLAKRFNISDIAIGLTIVAMGTSAPELVVNIISGSSELHDVVFGNIIGSNIFNIFLILGISSIIYPLTVQKSALWKEVPYSLLVTFIFFILVNDMLFVQGKENLLTINDSIVLMILFAVFLIYIFMNLKRNPDPDSDDIIIYGSVKTTVMIVLGAGGLIFGGRIIVDNAQSLALMWGMSEKLIGLTILAAGTSLPELATSAVAAFQKKSDLAVGNIVGSNIFNLLLVLGTTTLVSGNLSYNSALNPDLYMVMLGTLLLFLFMFTLNKFKLDRAEGLVYLLGFIAYNYYIFTRL